MTKYSQEVVHPRTNEPVTMNARVFKTTSVKCFRCGRFETHVDRSTNICGNCTQVMLSLTAIEPGEASFVGEIEAGSSISDAGE